MLNLEIVCSHLPALWWSLDTQNLAHSKPVLSLKISTWNPKQPFINGCFNWMIANLYIGNGCFTKHPFLTMVVWGSRKFAFALSCLPSTKISTWSGICPRRMRLFLRKGPRFWPGPQWIGGCFQKLWYPQIINFNRIFHYKPSILGYPYFWKHPGMLYIPSLSS